jgi:ubiquinone/menaquinone biosynthesis C-methylase UbiE
MDVAAAQAPFQRLLRVIFGVKESWRQDWNYRTNILNKTLGGNASSLEVDDESFDSLFLHNSWEHFEGESDFEFLKEAFRVLKPGGKVFITPLFFGIEGFVTTSPEIWTNKYQATSEPPKFREQIPMFIDNTIEQRYSQRHSAELLLRHFKDLAQLSPKIISIKNAKEFEGFHPFALVIEKL